MALYQADPKSTRNGFKHYAGYSPSPFGEVNSHGLHAIRSLPFIIMLYNTYMQKATI